VGKAEGKRPLGKTRRRWEDNIVMDLKEVGWGRMGWNHLTQDREQWGGGGACVHGNKTSGSVKCWEILEELSD
jgi:hypothetical protein